MNYSEIDKKLDDIQFLSPNEPLTEHGILRVLRKMEEVTQDLEDNVSEKKTINLWNRNMKYSKNDVVLHFKTENKQVSPEVGKREFAFVLVSMKDDNTNVPNYVMVNGVPDFTKSKWNLVNPMSYLLQDIVGMKKVVKEVFNNLIKRHVKDDHGLQKSADIEDNLLKRDYSNLSTPMQLGKYSLTNVYRELDDCIMKKSTDGVLEYYIKYQMDVEANKYVKIEDSRYFHQSSPILDESDQYIFSKKYAEGGMVSLTVNKTSDHKAGWNFSNLRYGTNIFHSKIEFIEPFKDDQYMVFFDTYEQGQFVFGFDKDDLQKKKQPTYGALVSMPMMMNKTKYGFDIVLPIHTHFNSIQKYKIGVPWNN